MKRSARAGAEKRRPRTPPPPPPPPTIDYGLDTPRVVYALGWGGMAALTAALLLGGAIAQRIPAGRVIAAALVGAGVVGVAAALAMAASSRWLKPVMRDRVLDALSLRGDERVLDLASGGGLMAIGAASRIGDGGHAVAFMGEGDRLRDDDVRVVENARRAGVAERVAAHRGDLRALPYPDATFDLVLSALALGGLSAAELRTAAVGEMVRVTRPGGRIVIVDRAHTGESAAALRACGATSVLRSGPRLWLFPPVRLILARR